MYELHEEGNESYKFPIRMEFDRFNPAYFDRRITLLLPTMVHGPRLPRAMNFDALSIPTVHSLDKGKSRELTASLLALWLERERDSKERLLSHLAKNGQVFTHNDHVLLSFVDGAMEAMRPLVVAWSMTTNLASGRFVERDIIEHECYTIIHVEMDTLHPLRPPCAQIIDAFYLYCAKMLTWRCQHHSRSNFRRKN